MILCMWLSQKLQFHWLCLIFMTLLVLLVINQAILCDKVCQRQWVASGEKEISRGMDIQGEKGITYYICFIFYSNWALAQVSWLAVQIMIPNVA